MQCTETQQKSTFNTRLLIQVGTLVLLSMLSALLINSLPEWLISTEGLLTAGVSVLFVSVLFLLSVSASRYASGNLLKSALFVWAFLLILETVFNSTGGDTESAMAGEFSVAVYGEVTVWIVVFLVLAFFLFSHPHWIRSIFDSHYKWLAAFGLLCTASATFSPRPMFSIGWAFVLWLVILVLWMCSILVRGVHDIVAFVRVTLWACCVLGIVQVYRVVLDPSAFLEGGRLGQNETTLSVVAGIVLVLSFTLRSVGTPILSIIIGFSATVVMLLAGGKAGIIGSVISLILFFLIKKQFGSALLSVAAIVIFGFALLSVVHPLKSYVDSYAEEGQAEHLTGRTDLWVAAMPVVRQSPILGHGYMASKFVTTEVEGVRWDASHLHNSFLDVLYNNGVVGLVLILYMHAVIILNLLRVIRYHEISHKLYEVGVAFFAVYINLLINSFFNAIIGGRPSILFMIFLALFALSDPLRRELTKENGLFSGPSPECSH